MFKVASLFVFLVLFIGCKPYNSNDANSSFIQGRWVLVDVKSKEHDTVDVNYEKQLTYLVFSGDSCTQQLVDIDEVSHFSFSIRNYHLNLEMDSVLFNTLRIEKLTDDSLILSKGSHNVWSYKRVGTNIYD